MDGAIERAEIFAAMADHRAREGGPGFGGDFDRAGDEELVVRLHLRNNVERRTLNVQHRITKYFRALFRDKADVTTALDPGFLYLTDVFAFEA